MIDLLRQHTMQDFPRNFHLAVDLHICFYGVQIFLVISKTVGAILPLNKRKFF